MNAREKFTQVMASITDLRGNTADTESAKRMAGLVLEAKDLRTTIEAENDAEALGDWASTSAGRIQIAAGKSPDASLVGFTPAGVTEITQGTHRSKQVLLAEEYGEGIVDHKVRSVINSAEYKKTFRDYLRSGSTPLQGGAMRLLNEASDSAGGFLVPEEISNMIIMREPTPTRMAGRVTQLTTSRDMISFPRVNYSTDDKYTTGVRVSWTGETNASASTHRSTDPTFGRSEVPIFTAMLSLALSLDMIEDMAFPVLSFVADKFGETVELLGEDMIINGTGVGQPTGILSRIGAAWSSASGSPEDKVLYVPSGTNSTIGTDGKCLIKTAMSLPEQYDDNAAWCFSKQSTALTLAQIYDGNGRPLWGTGVQDAGLVPGYLNRQLVGYPTFYSAFMPDIGDNKYPLLFGDYRGYFKVNRVGFSIQVLRERYAEENQVVVLGRLRFGGQVVEPFKLRALKAHSS